MVPAVQDLESRTLKSKLGENRIVLLDVNLTSLSSFNNPKYIYKFEEPPCVPAASPLGMISSISLPPAE